MNAEDRIEVRRIQVDGHHGALAGEQESAQPFEVDLDVYLDLQAAQTSDDLRTTVDYGSLTLAVAEIVTNTRFALLEALAGAIADDLLGDERIDRVAVTVRKMSPPIPALIESTGVRLVRGSPH